MTESKTTPFTLVKSLDDLPKKQTNRYEQYDCLVSRKGEVMHLVWNCEHQVWDERTGDDYFCDPLDVDGYMIFPDAIQKEKSA